MPYTPERLEYCRKWYAENKERLKQLPHRKNAKSISDKKYYQKNKERLRAAVKKYVEENREAISERRRGYYQKGRDKILEKRKAIRATPEYKAYRKEYRKKNKDRIYNQERVCGKRWMAKQIQQVSDAYIITLLTNKNVGVFDTWDEARQYPELIDIQRKMLITKRLLKNKNHQL